MILQSLTPQQMQVTDTFTKKRKQNLSFGPDFKQQRTYFQLSNSQLSDIKTPEDIKNKIDQAGFYIMNYRKGIAMKKSKPGEFKDLRQFNIGKILNKLNEKQLLLQFNTRLGATTRKQIKKLLLCITHKPYDVAGMSTDRNWRSCTHLQGHYGKTPLLMVQYGCMCAYLIKEEDKEIKQPLARTAIKRLVASNNPNNFIFKQQQRIYGDDELANELGMLKQVDQILQKSNEKTSNQSIIFNIEDNEIYTDSHIDEVIDVKKLNQNNILDLTVQDLFSLVYSQTINQLSQNLLIKLIENLKKQLYSDRYMKEQISYAIKKFSYINFIKKEQDILDWNIISRKKNLPEQFLNEFEHFLNWLEVSRGNILSNNLLLKHIGSVDWKYISTNYILTQEFIQLFKDNLNWSYIANNKTLTKELILKYCNYFNPIDITKTALPLSYIFKHAHEFGLYWLNIWKYTIFPEQRLEQVLNITFNSSRSFSNDMQHRLWNTISVNQHLDQTFIQNHADKLNWTYISKYQKLSQSFIKKYQNKVNWDYISKYQNLSEKFIEENIDNINFEFLMENNNISYNIKNSIKFKF